MIEAVMVSVCRVSTWRGGTALTAASGFFFHTGSRLFLVTSRHVLLDEATDHVPDRIELSLHSDLVNLTRVNTVTVPLYERGSASWREASDTGGAVDVAALQMDEGLVPECVRVNAFSADDIQDSAGPVDIGTPAIVLGYPLGFYDTVHYLPVARQAIVASEFGVRFQGSGYFLTDARTHRGTSGAPVLMRRVAGETRSRWKLLGIHSARMDMNTRVPGVDETLGLNCAWYADIIPRLIGTT
jgi:hypothetical protein